MPKIMWLVVLACLAVLVGITAFAIPRWSRSGAAASPSETVSASGTADPGSLQALLNDGGPNYTGHDYYKPTSSTLAAAAAGADNQQFYRLGELLVRDGLSDTIINLSREMNGEWYAWSERRAPRSEPDAFILAWRQVVTTMRSVPGAHFKFLWTLYPGQATAAEAWPGSAYVDYVGTDIFDWYGGPHGSYPHTASGALDWAGHWQEALTATPGGLDWIAQFSEADRQAHHHPRVGPGLSHLRRPGRHLFPDPYDGLADGSSCYRPVLVGGPCHFVRLARRPADR